MTDNFSDDDPGYDPYDDYSDDEIEEMERDYDPYYNDDEDGVDADYMDDFYEAPLSLRERVYWGLYWHTSGIRRVFRRNVTDLLRKCPDCKRSLRDCDCIPW